MRKSVAALGSALFFPLGPGTFVGLIPYLVTRWRLHRPLRQHAPLRALSVVLLVCGLGVMIQATVRFVVEGLGTPAPVAAPHRLVVGGPYRYVRNPMYLAVEAIILGQALLLGQPVLLLYGAAFAVAVASFVHWYEEPTLRRQFGEQYETYRRAVPPWLPRREPWDANEFDRS